MCNVLSRQHCVYGRLAIVLIPHEDARKSVDWAVVIACAMRRAKLSNSQSPRCGLGRSENPIARASRANVAGLFRRPVPASPRPLCRTQPPPPAPRVESSAPQSAHGCLKIVPRHQIPVPRIAVMSSLDVHGIPAVPARVGRDEIVAETSGQTAQLALNRTSSRDGFVIAECR